MLAHAVALIHTKERKKIDVDAVEIITCTNILDGKVKARQRNSFLLLENID